MKKIIFLCLVILTMTSIALADNCLDPQLISITKNGNGTFTVNLPPGSGYQFSGENYPISATGPISFAKAMVIVSSYQDHLPSNGPYQNILALRDILCWYGVNSAQPGNYPGGIFILTKLNSGNKVYDLPSSAWWYDYNTFFNCFFDLKGCSFTEV